MYAAARHRAEFLHLIGDETAHGWRRRRSGGHHPDSSAVWSVRLRAAGGVSRLYIINLPIYMPNSGHFALWRAFLFYQIVQNSTCSGRRNIEKILNTDILDICNRNPSFIRCRFNLLGDTNTPLGGWLNLLKTNATTREMANCLCSGRRRPAR